MSVFEGIRASVGFFKFTPQRAYAYKQYLATVFVIWAILLFYKFNIYYAHFIGLETRWSLIFMAVAYTIGGFFYYSLAPAEKITKSRGMELLEAIDQFCSIFVNYLKNYVGTRALHMPKMDKRLRIVLLGTIVKLIFLPMMLNFLFGNIDTLRSNLDQLRSLPSADIFSIHSFNLFIFPVLMYLIFVIDTTFFAVGYATESRFLHNRIRSVDPTVFGWVVCLMCYPPLISIFTKFNVWYADENRSFHNQYTWFIAHITMLILMTFYVSSAVSLGAKASNLTNRGIVTRGPYGLIRHPAYVFKNASWWIAALPILSVRVIVSMIVLSSVYALRAITEERHLLQDPDYVAYCRKVRYRFIPGVW